MPSRRFVTLPILVLSLCACSANLPLSELERLAALRADQEAVSSKPVDLDGRRALLGVAQAHAEAGAPTRALEVLAPLFELTSSIPQAKVIESRAYLLKGQLLRRLGKTPEALNALNLAVHTAELVQASRTDVRPDLSQAYRLRGTILAEGGHDRLALEDFAKLEPADREHPDYWLNVGRIEFNRGNYNLAQKAFEALLALEPDSVEARFRLASAQQAQGLYRSALENHLKVLAIAPDYPQLHPSLGLTYSYLGRCDEAGTHYARAGLTGSVCPRAPEPARQAG